MYANTSLKRILEVLEDSRNIVILPHLNADGDAIGSAIALCMALRSKGHHADVYLEEDIPAIYSFLPSKGVCEVYFGSAPEYETAVAVDTGDLDRLGSRTELFRRCHTTVNIDHHSTNSEFGVYNYIDSKAAAVAEIIYAMMAPMDATVDQNMAVCLYTAIATDTGGFRYSNTTFGTHVIVSELMKKGVNVPDISERIFDTLSYEKAKLLGAAINSIELFEKGKIAFISVSDKMMKESGAREEDCDGIVNTARNINGVEVGIMLRQKSEGEVKASLRSKSYVDVADIAGMYGGGGHKRAAGCYIKGDLENAKKRLLEDLKGVI